MHELLVTLALVGLALSLGIPKISSSADEYQVTLTLNQLEGDLQSVRAAALTSGCPHTVQFSSGGTSYTATKTSGCYGGSFSDTDRSFFTRSIPSALSVQGLTQVRVSTHGFVVDSSSKPTTHTFTIAQRGTTQKNYQISSLGGIS
jgi:Tfp pilus assembly protein FimT